MNHITQDSVYHLIHLMELQYYEKGQILVKSYDYADSMFIICAGVCELST